MIRGAVLASVLGKLLVGLAAAMLPAFAVSLLSPGDDPAPILQSLLITVAAGLALLLPARPGAFELSLREGLLLSLLAWVGVCVFGALPFYFSPYFPTFADAVFESTSGFTTTGATVLTDVEVLPRSIQLWRCGTHWIGGMGILLLAIAVLPLIGAGGIHLYRAEFSGARSEKLKPRIAETASSLWKIYLSLTLLEYLALRLAGMNGFESICHTFSTLGTGGFSTRAASVGGFESPVIEYIIVVFMFLAGLNFTQQYRLYVERQPGRFFSDPEVRAYALFVAVSTLLVWISVVVQSGYGVSHGFRSALFVVTTTITTTGFVSDDYEKWAPAPQLLILALMVCGGCTGSTAGGLKVARIVTVARALARELKKVVERRAVFSVRYGEQPLPEAAVQTALSTLCLAVFVHFGASMVLTAAGLDVLSAISAVVATMFNVGPGLGSVGPMDNYNHLSPLSKWTLSVCMLAGRLEFYTAFVVLTPAFWRK